MGVLQLRTGFLCAIREKPSGTAKVVLAYNNAILKTRGGVVGIVQIGGKGADGKLRGDQNFAFRPGQKTLWS